MNAKNLDKSTKKALWIIGFLTVILLITTSLIFGNIKLLAISLAIGAISILPCHLFMVKVLMPLIFYSAKLIKLIEKKLKEV